jgi:hypothetical protein
MTSFDAYMRNVNTFLSNGEMSANVWAAIRDGQELTLPDTIYVTTEHDGTRKYWTYVSTPVNGQHFISAGNIDTKIYYNDQEIDIGQRGIYELKSDIEIPTTLRWGSGLSAEISYQIRRVSYGVEETDEDLQLAYAAFIAAKKDYQMAQLNIKFLSASDA